MPHPEIENATPFAFSPLFVADEEGRPVVAFLTKGTFDVGTAGVLTVAEEQLDVNFAGEPYGEPGESSFRFEPETAFIKPTTDVVLFGHACAPHTGMTDLEVGIQVGPVAQVARVFGNRTFSKGLLRRRTSPPEPFERIPLIWERAFGGWDKSPKNPEHHDYEARNPVGVGFQARRGVLEDGAPLPNIEPFEGRMRPVGFGFVSPDWQPRAELAGTCDETWSKERSPLLPRDFDRRFFNAAPPELITPRHLRGNETVRTRHLAPEGKWEFALPGLAPPTVLLATRFQADTELETSLDTVIVDADARKLHLLWRCHAVLRTGPHDVRAVRVRCVNAPVPPSATVILKTPSATPGPSVGIEKE